MRVQTINLNLIPTGVPPILHLSQYDTEDDGSVIYMIYDGTSPADLTDCTVVLNGTKPDNTVFSYPCTAYTNYATSAIYSQMSNVKGITEAELRITNGDESIGTLNFQIIVEEAGVSQVDLSNTEIPALLDEIQASVDEAEYWAGQAAGAVAGVSSFNGRSGSVLPAAGDYDSSMIEMQNGDTVEEAVADITDRIDNLPDGVTIHYNANDKLEVIGGGGGGGGSVITVTTAETTLYGETATLTDGNSSYTATISNSGVATFSGVTITGDLTITATDGVDTATYTLNVPYFGNYTATLAFWSATINITTDTTDLYGQTITVKNSSDVTVATTTFSNAGTASVTVREADTYTVSSTYSGYTDTETVVVSAQTSYSVALHLFTAPITISTTSTEFYGLTITVTKGGSTVGTTAFSNAGSASFTAHETGEFTFTVTYSGENYTSSVTVSEETTYSTSIDAIPEGSTVTPTDDIQTWLECAGITDKSYTTVSEVLADSTTLLALMSDSNAVDYLVRSTTFATDICADSTAMTDIGANNYCADTLLADSTWLTAICNSTYFESVLNVKVPTMTSNTTPSGEAGASAVYQTYDAWLAFDGNDSSQWLNELNSSYIYYKFTASKCIKKVVFINPTGGGGYKVATYQISASNDGSDWTNLTDELTAAQTGDLQQVTINNTNSYLYYRFYILSTYYANHNGLSTLQFYGREDV